MKFKKTAIAMGLASVVLTGCNSSSSSSDPVSVSGSAVKGALKDALVIACATTQTTCVDGAIDELYDVDSNTTLTDNLAYTTTDENGDYSLLVSYSGPVIFRTLATTNTTQSCDYSDCDPDDVVGLELENIAYIDSDSATVTAPINALTTLATAAQKEIGISENKTAFASQSSEASKSVLTLLGLDDTDDTIDLFSLNLPSATASTLTGASASAQKLSLVNASVGSLGTGTTTTLATSIKNLSNSVSSVVKSVLAKEVVKIEAINALSSTVVKMKTEIASKSEALSSDVTFIAADGYVAPVLNDDVKTTADNLVVVKVADTQPVVTGAAGSN